MTTERTEEEEERARRSLSLRVCSACGEEGRIHKKDCRLSPLSRYGSEILSIRYMRWEARWQAMRDGDRRTRWAFLNPEGETVGWPDCGLHTGCLRFSSWILRGHCPPYLTHDYAGIPEDVESLSLLLVDVCRHRQQNARLFHEAERIFHWSFVGGRADYIVGPLR